MGKNKKRGATNKDALVATGKKEKNALFANCSAWMAKAKDKGAKEHAAMQQCVIAADLNFSYADLCVLEGLHGVR